MSTKLYQLGIGAVLLLTMLGSSSLAAAVQVADAAQGRDRLIVVARGDADFDQLRAAVQRSGATIVNDIRSGGMLVVSGTPAQRAQIQASGLAKGIAKDHIETLTSPTGRQDFTNATAARSRTVVDPAASQSAAIAANRATATDGASAAGSSTRRPITGDPAFTFPGLMWSIDRIEAPAAWQTTTGDNAVRVAVADTGLDFTHAELAPKVARVVDFTGTEDPPICSTFLPNPFTGQFPGIGDADLAAMFGGPETTDWNGHGSWIGGNIAAAMDGQGVNGIAPKVKLVALKISQWCGSAYDSEILDAFAWAGDHHIDVVSISFGGYLDLSQPDQAIIWGQYIQLVERMRNQGTIIASSAGNEHVQIGDSGLVTSHGPTATPCTPTPTAPCPPFRDVFGQFETPAGIPGVVDVSSTGNIVVPSSNACQPDQVGSATDLNAVCKPTSDRHQAGGQGKQDQLSYFSNYGTRIDVAGPGGARKFNLPFWDRGGTPGYPYTIADFTTAFEDFSTTSNWAIEIPCFTFTGGGFPANQCYSTIQGTSMATPHVSATLALIASNDASARHNPDKLERILKNSARHVTGNKTQVLSATDKSPADLTGVQCNTGYCHLGGLAVPDNEAYGAGIVDARRAVR